MPKASPGESGEPRPAFGWAQAATESITLW
jgi:hypothetical protein